MKQRYSTTDLSLKLCSMPRFLKKLAVFAVFALSVQLSHGFALLGPLNEPFQVPVIGYGLPYLSANGAVPGDPVILGDIGGPKQYGQGYRRNVPVLYYACDGDFFQFFGSNGVAAVDQAFAIWNTLTNVSQYSSDLSEFPLSAQRINYEAQNLFLTDVKSVTLHLITEQMGLAQPDRYTWTLDDRYLLPGTSCPVGEVYDTIMRNFDIVPSPLNHVQNSAYVNGTLYSYGIIENCTGPNPLALAIPYAVDINADTYTAVAADAFTYGTFGNIGLNVGGVGLHIGGFYNYLTRDDIGGLRYLLQTNNYALESAGPDTVQFTTNNSPQLLVTQDLGLLAAQAGTNNAAALQALYPGLIVTDTTNFFKVVNTPVISLVVSNAPPFAPAGTFIVTAVTNIVPTIVEVFGHEFGNIITNKFSSQSVQSLQIVSTGPSPFSPAGTPPTLKTTTTTFRVNHPAGDFYILPTNTCAIKILNNNLLPTVVATTNTTFTLTNTVAGGTSNQSLTVNIVTYFTNHTIVYLPVSCPANTADFRQGIEHIRFVRRDFDSLIGTFWDPVTNNYTLTALNTTNSSLQSQTIQRVATRPDFLFTTSDQALGTGVVPFVGTVTRGINFNQVSSNGLAGPGTIQSPTTFAFNNIGPLFFNAFAPTTFFDTDQSSAIQSLAWASFDGTTNDPVVYPNGTSINNFINQLVIRVQPTSLPNGKRGTAYSFVYTNSISGIVYTNTLSVTGGQSPYTWSVSPSSPGGLPAGLSLTPDGQLTGTPSGHSISTTYDFTVRVTDAGARFVDAPLSITITP